MHKTMRSLLFLFIVLGSTLMAGCGSSLPVVKPFKMDIQQGNVVTSKMLLQLRPGMTKSQVKFIMGTPLINDSFHTNRWDYFYQMRRAGKVIEQRRVILDFEKELLARVRGDVVPQGTPGADTGVTLANEPSAATKPVVKEGLLENLKFWKSNQAPDAVPAPKPEATKPPAKEKGMLDKLKFWEKDQPKAETKAAPLVESVAPSKEPASEALPAGAAPMVAAPDSPAAEAELETPSMLAVPIEIAPAEPASKPSAPVESSPEAAPAVVPAQVEPIAPAVAKELEVPTPAPSAPSPANRDESFIFRLDRNLDAENLKNAQTAPAESDAKVKVEEEKVVPAEDPGYFERMLEKIGF